MKAPIAEIAEKLGREPQDCDEVAGSTSLADAAMGLKDPRSTTLTPAEEAIARRLPP